MDLDETVKASVWLANREQTFKSALAESCTSAASSFADADTDANDFFTGCPQQSLSEQSLSLTCDSLDGTSIFDMEVSVIWHSGLMISVVQHTTQPTPLSQNSKTTRLKQCK